MLKVSKRFWPPSLWQFNLKHISNSRANMGMVTSKGKCINKSNSETYMTGNWWGKANINEDPCWDRKQIRDGRITQRATSSRRLTANVCYLWRQYMEEYCQVKLVGKTCWCKHTNAHVIILSTVFQTLKQSNDKYIGPTVVRRQHYHTVIYYETNTRIRISAHLGKLH